MTARRVLAILTGLALILLPFLGVALKLVSMGWMVVVILLYGGLVLSLGWALQVVIAATGFFWPRGPVQSTAVRRRATIAAWLSSVAFVLGCVFLVDGGDAGGSGSTFQVWFGLMSDGLTPDGGASDVSMTICGMATLVWLAAFLWLLVEWIIGWVLRARARRAAPRDVSGQGDGLSELFTPAP